MGAIGMDPTAVSKHWGFLILGSSDEGSHDFESRLGALTFEISHIFVIMCLSTREMDSVDLKGI